MRNLNQAHRTQVQRQPPRFQAHRKSPRLAALAFLAGALVVSTASAASYVEAPPPSPTGFIAVAVPGSPPPTPLATWIAKPAEPGLPDATPARLATPAPTPTPKPKPKPGPTPWPTHPPRPKLYGKSYKPWREFTANVEAARTYARSVLSKTSFYCLDVLFDRESGWRVHAGNRTSGAYGIPQALPGSKMAWAGDDWRDNATTQVRWGIHYIKGRYGNACIALDHSYRTGWY